MLIYGKPLKSVIDEINLQILNCVWDSMKGATWFSENSELTLDYVCVNDSVWIVLIYQKEGT